MKGGQKRSRGGRTKPMKPSEESSVRSNLQGVGANAGGRVVGIYIGRRGESLEALVPRY